VESWNVVVHKGFFDLWKVGGEEDELSARKEGKVCGIVCRCLFVVFKTDKVVEDAGSNATW